VNRADRAALTTIALSWALFAIYYLTVGTLESPWFAVFGIAYMWIPGLTALWLARREGVRLPVWGRPDRWWLAAWLLPLLLTAGAAVVSLPLGEYVGLSGIKQLMEGAAGELAGLPDWALWLSLALQILFAGVTINALAALGEE
jgi:hypothetical protein